MDETDLMTIAWLEPDAAPLMLLAEIETVDDDAERVWRRRRDETNGDMP